MLRSGQKSRIPGLLGRAALSCIYVLALWAMVYVTLIALLIKWAFVLVRRNDPALLTSFFQQLLGFGVQSVSYILFLDDRPPYPFNPIPVVSVVESTAAEQPAAAKPKQPAPAAKSRQTTSAAKPEQTTSAAKPASAAKPQQTASAAAGAAKPKKTQAKTARRPAKPADKRSKSG